MHALTVEDVHALAAVLTALVLPGFTPASQQPAAGQLLTGVFPGTVRIGVVEDELVALRRARPLILVMPFGSTGTFTDKEWANGIRPHEGWETFVARDLAFPLNLPQNP